MLKLSVIGSGAEALISRNLRMSISRAGFVGCLFAALGVGLALANGARADSVASVPPADQATATPSLRVTIDPALPSTSEPLTLTTTDPPVANPIGIAALPPSINVPVPVISTPGGNLATLYYNHNPGNNPDSTPGSGTVVINSFDPNFATPLPSAVYGGAAVLASLGVMRLFRKLPAL